MPDQPSGFTVTDRRKFTLEGDLREGASTAEETPAAKARDESGPEVRTQTRPETRPE